MLSRFSDFENTFALMDELQRCIDRIWEDVDPSWRSWQPASPSSRALSASAFPRLNLFDAGSNLVLKADVPGLSEKDVQVTLSDGGISLSGERKVVAPEGYSAHRQERSQVQFSRSLTLPCKVNPEQTTASVKDGVLTITLAKAAEAQPPDQRAGSVRKESSHGNREQQFEPCNALQPFTRACATAPGNRRTSGGRLRECR